MSRKFTYGGYSNLLQQLTDKGYSLVPFRDAKDTQEPVAILRHDIDLSIPKAVEMATVEHSRSVRSTYFVMLSSEWYNIHSKHEEAGITRIVELGHEIGLHFDVRKYEDFSESTLENAIEKEMGILSAVIGVQVKSVSWHIPREDLLGKRLGFLSSKGISNAYDPEYFGNYKYLSDSMMRWREDPELNINPIKFPKLQILTHPVWYSGTSGTTDVRILKDALAEKKFANIAYLEGIRPGLFSMLGV